MALDSRSCDLVHSSVSEDTDEWASFTSLISKRNKALYRHDEMVEASDILALNLTASRLERMEGSVRKASMDDTERSDALDESQFAQNRLVRDQIDVESDVNVLDSQVNEAGSHNYDSGSYYQASNCSIIINDDDEHLSKFDDGRFKGKNHENDKGSQQRFVNDIGDSQLPSKKLQDETANGNFARSMSAPFRPSRDITIGVQGKKDVHVKTFHEENLQCACENSCDDNCDDNSDIQFDEKDVEYMQHELYVDEKKISVTTNWYIPQTSDDNYNSESGSGTYDQRLLERVDDEANKSRLLTKSVGEYDSCDDENMSDSCISCERKRVPHLKQSETDNNEKAPDNRANLLRGDPTLKFPQFNKCGLNSVEFHFDSDSDNGSDSSGVGQASLSGMISVELCSIDGRRTGRDYDSDSDISFEESNRSCTQSDTDSASCESMYNYTTLCSASESDASFDGTEEDHLWTRRIKSNVFVFEEEEGTCHSDTSSIYSQKFSDEENNISDSDLTFADKQDDCDDDSDDDDETCHSAMSCIYSPKFSDDENSISDSDVSYTKKENTATLYQSMDGQEASIMLDDKPSILHLPQIDSIEFDSVDSESVDSELDSGSAVSEVDQVSISSFVTGISGSDVLSGRSDLVVDTMNKPDVCTFDDDGDDITFRTAVSNMYSPIFEETRKNYSQEDIVDNRRTVFVIAGLASLDIDSDSDCGSEISGLDQVSYSGFVSAVQSAVDSKPGEECDTVSWCDSTVRENGFDLHKNHVEVRTPDFDSFLSHEKIAADADTFQDKETNPINIRLDSIAYSSSSSDHNCDTFDLDEFSLSSFVSAVRNVNDTSSENVDDNLDFNIEDRKEKQYGHRPNRQIAAKCDKKSTPKNFNESSSGILRATSEDERESFAEHFPAASFMRAITDFGTKSMANYSFVRALSNFVGLTSSQDCNKKNSFEKSDGSWPTSFSEDSRDEQQNFWNYDLSWNIFSSPDLDSPCGSEKDVYTDDEKWSPDDLPFDAQDRNSFPTSESFFSPNETCSDIYDSKKTRFKVLADTMYPRQSTIW
eukprot:CAMPEP_0194121022 /NCGR_PEP_ID=MMETSP0150-20130528/45407_1 /TAXON_ID=122233 /ORGANISM="Chaetoceros debilis, Strain MM31A-1" /LENGTH=1046 /DNA_ID=CAMNT_0038813309 /DNA_START=20 /DNA_END=3157 /DNA_ORIENTATION=+